MTPNQWSPQPFRQKDPLIPFSHHHKSPSPDSDSAVHLGVDKLLNVRQYVALWSNNSVPKGRCRLLPPLRIHNTRNYPDTFNMATILLLNGPNLNYLGHREPTIYGHTTLADIEQSLTLIAKESGHQLNAFQSNHEGALIDHIYQEADQTDFILINPGGLTHTSISLRDALAGVDIPFIEIHLSNIYKREAYRKTSYFSDLAVGIVSGFGPTSYQLALQAAITQLKKD